MTEWNARTWVLDALEASTDADPAIVATELADSLDSHRLRDALRQTLPSYVSSLVTRERAAHFRSQRDDETCADNGSPRWGAVRSIFTDRLFTPDGWKMLRDCTCDDLLAAAQDRQDRAASLVAAADKLSALADRLVAEGAGKVGDLPEDVVRAVLA